MAKDKDLEERLLRKQELEELVQNSQFELAELREKEAKIVKPKQIEKDFKALTEEQIFSRQAIYDYFNEITGQITPYNGLQAQATFGLNHKEMQEFVNKGYGSTYRKPEKFTLRFRHFEIN